MQELHSVGQNLQIIWWCLKLAAAIMTSFSPCPALFGRQPLCGSISLPVTVKVRRMLEWNNAITLLVLNWTFLKKIILFIIYACLSYPAPSRDRCTASTTAWEEGTCSWMTIIMTDSCITFKSFKPISLLC